MTSIELRPLLRHGLRPGAWAEAALYLPLLMPQIAVVPGLQVIAVVPRHPEEDSRVGGPPIKHGQRIAWERLKEAGGDRF